MARTFHVMSNVSSVKIAADKGELYTAAKPAPAAQAIIKDLSSDRIST